VSFIAGYGHYITNAQIIISFATAFYFMRSYTFEVSKAKENGKTLEYFFFITLVANSSSVVFTITMTDFWPQGDDPRIVWLGGFVILFLFSLYLTRKKGRK